jgi:hypothetical protein
VRPGPWLRSCRLRVISCGIEVVTLLALGGDVLQPEDDSWAAVIYGSAGDDSERLGTAVVVDDFRLLTCLHVLADEPTQGRVWVAFPKAVGPVQR